MFFIIYKSLRIILFALGVVLFSSFSHVDIFQLFGLIFLGTSILMMRNKFGIIIRKDIFLIHSFLSLFLFWIYFTLIANESIVEASFLLAFFSSVLLYVRIPNAGYAVLPLILIFTLQSAFVIGQFFSIDFFYLFRSLDSYDISQYDDVFSAVKRVSGTLGYAHEFSFGVVALFIAFLYIYRHTKKLSFFFLSILTGILIFLTLSRSALVSVLIVILIDAWLNKNILKLLVPVFFVFSVVYFLWFSESLDFLDIARVVDFNSEEEGARFGSWVDEFNLSLNSLIFGQVSSVNQLPPHNVFFLVLRRFGILGVILYIVVIIRFINLFKQDEFLFFSLLTMFFIQSMTHTSNFFYKDIFGFVITAILFTLHINYQSILFSKNNFTS